ncbi:hypothetical protein [Chryseobacterium vrystaatense]|uniref:Phage abortive infection protein n=1 Tax=Chryseobacterium vrystaatense TaxID=307480 RepID=A0ABR4UF44_9FLAO|nr:hypothetical protein [Chryseobacterium vrystaatense]KFF21372.1 hypothetical protein IW16_26840 [Chryseobacterium vrystaatense]
MLNNGIVRIGLITKKRSASYEFKDSLLEEYLVNKNVYNEEQLHKLQILFKLLFLEAPDNRLSIGFNHNYLKYFKDELSNSEISNREYKNAVNSSFNVLIDYIKKWENEGKLFSILPHLFHTNPIEFKEKINFENYIRILFFLNINKSEREDLRYFQVDYNYLHSCIFDRIDEKVNKYYKGQTTEFKNFIKELLLNGTYPFIFEMNFCKYICENIYIDSQNLIFSKNELENFLIDFLQRIAEKMEYWDNNIFEAFWRTVLKGNEKIEYNTWKDIEIILPQAIEIFKKVIKRFPDEFLLEIIEKEKRGSKKMKINGFIFMLFASSEEFIEFIKSNVPDENSSLKAEFLRFADTVLPKNEFVDFDFKIS